MLVVLSAGCLERTVPTKSESEPWVKEDGAGTSEPQVVSGNKTRASITRALVN